MLIAFLGVKHEPLSVLFSADSVGLRPVGSGTDGLSTAALALHSSNRWRRTVYLGICSDVPSENGKILLEWAELGRTIPGMAGIEARAGRIPRSLRVDDSHSLPVESQVGNDGRSTRICGRRVAGNFDRLAQVP